MAPQVHLRALTIDSYVVSGFRLRARCESIALRRTAVALAEAGQPDPGLLAHRTELAAAFPDAGHGFRSSSSVMFRYRCVCWMSAWPSISWIVQMSTPSLRSRQRFRLCITSKYHGCSHRGLARQPFCRSFEQTYVLPSATTLWLVLLDESSQGRLRDETSFLSHRIAATEAVRASTRGEQFLR